MVWALPYTPRFRGPIGLSWRRRRLHVDTESLRGPLYYRCLAYERVFCTEWLMYLVLSELRLYSEIDGSTLDLNDEGILTGHSPASAGDHAGKTPNRLLLTKVTILFSGN